MLFRKCTDVLGKYEALSKNYIFLCDNITD